MSVRSLHNTLQTQFLQTPRSVLAWICGRGWGSCRPSRNPSQQESTDQTDEQKLLHRSVLLQRLSLLYSQRSQGRGIHSGTLMHMIIQWLLNLRVGFGEEGVLAHETMTLHINVLYRGREAVKSGTPCWFPVFLLLIRSLWRASAPEVWAGQSISLSPPRHTALCSLQNLTLLPEKLITE